MNLKLLAATMLLLVALVMTVATAAPAAPARAERVSDGEICRTAGGDRYRPEFANLPRGLNWKYPPDGCFYVTGMGGAAPSPRAATEIEVIDNGKRMTQRRIPGGYGFGKRDEYMPDGRVVYDRKSHVFTNGGLRTVRVFWWAS